MAALSQLSDHAPALSAALMAPAVATGAEINIAAALAAVAVPAAAYAGAGLGRKRRFLEGYARSLLVRSMAREYVDRAAAKLSSAALGAAAGFAALLCCALLSLAAGAFSPLMLLAAAPLAASPLLVILPYSNRASERSERLAVEYPFFMVLASIVAYCGGTVYMALQQVRKASAVFKQMSAEAEEAERKASLSGYGVIKGLEAHAEAIPNENLSRALLTCTSVWRTGGDLSSTTDDLAAEAMKHLTNRFEKFAASVSTMVEVFFTVVILLPMGMSLTVLVGGEMSGTMVLLNIVLIPLTSLAILLGVRNAMPRLPNDISPDPKTLLKSVAAAAACALGLAVPFLLGLPVPPPMIASAAIAAACLTLYYGMRHMIGEINDAELELKRFLRAAVEERKAGKTMYHALKSAAAQKYRHFFDAFAKRFSVRLSMGLGIFRAGANSRSWLAKAIIWLVDAVDRLGGASPELLEKVISALTSYSASREAARGRIKLFLYITYATPFIMASMFGMIHPLIAGTAFGGVSELPQAEIEQPAAPGATFRPSPEAAARLVDSGMVIMVIASAAMAFAISYSMDMHPWGLHRVAIAVLLYVPAYYSLPVLSELTRASLFPAR